jgi:hypothetical protein
MIPITSPFVSSGTVARSSMILSSGSSSSSVCFITGFAIYCRGQLSWI